jgi:GAF domain-containing protein
MQKRARSSSDEPIGIIHAVQTQYRAFRSAIVTRKVQGIRLDLNRKKTLRALLASGQPRIVPDRATDAEELAYLETVLGDTYVVHAWMGIPLIAKERVIGVLAMFYHEVGYYRPRAQERVQLFANQAALAIENAQLYQATQEAAVLEGATAWRTTCTTQ